MKGELSTKMPSNQSKPPKTQDELKREAAQAAVSLIESGMVVGLGHGTTALHAIHYLGQRMQTGELRNIRAIPCSRQAEDAARDLGIQLTDFREAPLIDITIDGADEVDADFNVIKGGGGALLREKVVAQNTRREVIVVDESKLSPRLGTHWAVPIETLPFACHPVTRYLENLGGNVTQRNKPAGKPFYSEQGNYILDSNFGPITDPYHLAAALSTRAGIFDHGLFLGLVHDVVVASQTGVRFLHRPC